jgi:hypothetical protein
MFNFGWGGNSVHASKAIGDIGISFGESFGRPEGSNLNQPNSIVAIAPVIAARGRIVSRVNGNI